jgi:hypothetical protein
METVRIQGVGHQMQAEDFAGFRDVLSGILAHQFN